MMFQNLIIILWKNLLMRKNHYVATASEVIFPIGIIILANLALPNLPAEVDNDQLSFEAFTPGQCVEQHSYYDKIVYEPSTPFTDKLMLRAACYAGYKKSSVKSGLLDSNTSQFTIGITFNLHDNFSLLPTNLNYTIYPTSRVWVHMTSLWRHLDIPRYSIPVLRNVIQIQRAIDSSYLYLKNVSVLKVTFENTDFFERGPKIFSILIYMSLFVAFSLMVPPIISRVVQEKFTGAKELILMMGVKKLELWIGKFLDSILFLIILVSGMLFFLYIPLRENSSVLKISPLILWSFILYGLSGVIVFLFFLSCFFEKASLAVYVTEIIWTLSFIFSNFLSSLVELPILVKYLICLFPHVTLMNGVSILLDFDFYGKDIKLHEKLSGKEDYLSLFEILIMMSINLILYSILTWYFEQVMPSKFGVPKPYGFCFKKSYWFPSKIHNYNGNIGMVNLLPTEGFEQVPSGLPIGISLQNVKKVYSCVDKAPVTAVKDANINFFHGEISALLGHNGAGKTTIFSIITGLTSPTSGKVLIDGYDLSLNVDEARQSLGLCPQKDMLFDDLTTFQILKFYGVVKGLRLKEAIREATELIERLKLEPVENTQTRYLSGGQKRKVSLAIALIGGSKVLILDEPTSGMDPEIRREIWEILLGLRGERTILITTHFMEEADALCDRIAVMDNGQIKCYGSPMFLKSKYGKGYVLSIVAKEIDHVNEITRFVKQYVESSKFKSQNIRTFCYELPENEVDNFPTLLAELDSKQENGEIVSYSISVSTLEDVFLKLRNKSSLTDDMDFTDSPPYQKFVDPSVQSPKSKVSNSILFFYQLLALMIKKWIFFKKTFKFFLLYSVLPILLILSSLLLNNSNSLTKKIDLSRNLPIQYSASLYCPFLILFNAKNNSAITKVFPEFVKSLNCDVQEVDNIKKEIYETFKNDFYNYSRIVNLGIQFLSDEKFIFHNDEAVHMIPVALNLLHNFAFKMNNVSGSLETSVNIKFVSKEQYFIPPRVPKCNLEVIPDFSGIQTLFYFLAPLKEDIFGAKEIQLMITPTALYWLSHLLFDVISFVPYMVIVCLLYAFLQESDYIYMHSGELFASLLLWGIGLILLAYIISTLIRNEAGAFSASIIIYVIFTFIINNPIASPNLPSFFQYLHPTCILKVGYANLCAGYNNHYIVILICYNISLFFLLYLKDSKFLSESFHKIINKLVEVKYLNRGDEDELVKKEKSLVENLIKKQNTFGYSLVVSDLKRWYLKSIKFSPAVNGISFTVNEGECFGLLGVNGAGKTSTFKMLTGNISPSYGLVFACSENLSLFNKQKYLFHIGYCPQTGGLIPIFKGRELLKFIGRLRGIRGAYIEAEATNWLEKLDLLEFADQTCETYSGGNQRKLSTAIALIGNCRLIFLDEPTSGVDPASRRAMWNVISETQKKKQSVILTSHSMDECEALCSRLAIMIEGRFCCLGEITTLKEKFGQGYSVQLKITCGTLPEKVQTIKQSFLEIFGPEVNLVDEHLTILQYFVGRKNMSWASLFSKLKEFKDSFGAIESYIASETNLEQIFIYLARNH